MLTGSLSNLICANSFSKERKTEAGVVGQHQERSGKTCPGENCQAGSATPV